MTFVRSLETKLMSDSAQLPIIFIQHYSGDKHSAVIYFLILGCKVGLTTSGLVAKCSLVTISAYYSYHMLTFFPLMLKPFSHFLRKCSISGKVPTKPLLQEGGKSSSQPLLFECYVCFKLSAITVSTFLKHSCSLLKSSKNTFSPHMRDILAASNQDFSTWTQTIVQNWHQF